MSLEKNVIEEQSINDVNYELLKKQFPNAVSIDENGKYVIDPQKLQLSLDPSKAEIKEDGYGLNWVGKKEAYHNAFTKNYKVLKPLKDDSKNWDETENILIKGNNLDALKILRQNYFESIKMIYIDPPYNTKTDGFVYNDNFTSSTEQTLAELGYDKEYIDYIENIQGAKTHSGWLNFMYPRILLAKDLLKDDGIIFISIDDNEVAQLKILCDEVFGEDNFLANIIWEKRFTRSNSAKGFATLTEHILTYRKSDKLDTIRESRNEKANSTYSNPDNDARGVWTSVSYIGPTSIEQRPNLHYKLINPITNQEVLHPTKPWKYEKSTHLRHVQENRLYWGKDGNNTYPRLKRFLSEMDEGMVPVNFWNRKEAGTTDEASKALEKLFKCKVFDFPKPITLVQKAIKMVINNDDIILDFFAGSGTTAHAIMDLNAQDNGTRKFICVQWAEKTPEKSEAKKAGYETIFDITKARIDKAGEQLAKGDIGFRTFEIVEDQKQKIYQKSLEDVNQDDLLAMMEKSDISSNEEILYNLFVAETLPLSTKHQELIKDKLYLASNVAFILGDITSDELVEVLKDKKECEYITVYSPNISNDKFTLEIESNISKLGIKSDKLRFRG
ncbi:site-specific DNA-methyltransferase [Aliarcobacter butzleri]|uniref:site-specific DNA-methyltransferase n=1 Tax=Aliarcobacter butzleri TaxID=28197 RepID=UPI001EDB14D0|nr:site-specific DNA-methyltransferase [Aliarcobacter butzleri]MCG3667378.1 site-specific DNA-methyltransferase [Aliarcobacter butzleri]MCT7602462.1 site-specific DNA-methyltransferase [Aliarcobacter butzleri]MCT7606928.1 site-specific DNA-methyltransferase [Aliarcobacter butzleri]MCT7609092.1 site-specific DNA-methyltransferase [Aliarcobacter butzleri]